MRFHSDENLHEPGAGNRLGLRQPTGAGLVWQFGEPTAITTIASINDRPNRKWPPSAPCKATKSTPEHSGHKRKRSADICIFLGGPPRAANCAANGFVCLSCVFSSWWFSDTPSVVRQSEFPLVRRRSPGRESGSGGSQFPQQVDGRQRVLAGSRISGTIPLRAGVGPGRSTVIAACSACRRQTFLRIGVIFEADSFWGKRCNWPDQTTRPGVTRCGRFAKNADRVGPDGRKSVPKGCVDACRAVLLGHKMIVGKCLSLVSLVPDNLF